jgi:hypothetical protein
VTAQHHRPGCSGARRRRDAATEVDQSLGVAALAAAYDGDLIGAARLRSRLSRVGGPPTIEAFGAYVAGEIDALAGRSAAAELQYRRAVELSQGSGATFVEGVASVGLVALQARGGRPADALAGFGHLLDYWERTGGWVQQWTTLRNLAGVLRAVGDTEAAALIDDAADRAADAPAVSTTTGPAPGVGRPCGPGGMDRSQVLDLARRAIDQHVTRLRTAPTGDPAEP